MSGSPRAGAKPEKTMSSRLLTMKFMQRAAASTAAKEAHASASEDNPPTPKRPRLSTEPDSPATPRTSDLEAISAALAAEEEKRREAIARQAAEAGETQWVLDIPSVTSQTPPRPPVVAADSLDADDEVNVGGRRPYGNFKRKGGENQWHQKEAADDDEGEIINPADPAQVEAMIKKAKAKAEKKEKKSQPEKVKLSQLTSISGSGRGPPGGTPPQKKKKRKSR